MEDGGFIYSEMNLLEKIFFIYQFPSLLIGWMYAEYKAYHAKKWTVRYGVGKTGSCHLFRHTMATVMLENGADIRYLQEMLGHAKIDTTQIYTQVSIRKLKEIHTATHPAKMRKMDDEL